MDVHIEDLSSVEKKLTLTVAAEAVDRELDAAYARLKHEAKVAGFRPGRVPRKLLERRFGAEVAAEVGARLAERALGEAVVAHSLRLAGAPRLEPGKVARGMPFVLAATVEVRPEVTLSDWDGLSVGRDEVVVTEDEIDAQLESLRHQSGVLVPLADDEPMREGRGAELTIRFRDDDGKEQIRTGVTVGLPGAASDPALLALVSGMKAGESREGEATVVVDPRRPAELSPARPARVTVDRVVELRNPDLDAAFAERMGHGSIAELRRGLRDRLATAKEERARARLERALVEQLVARNPFAVPSNLVSERARVLVASIAAQLGEQSGSASPPTLDDLADSRRADVLAEAEHSVRRELVLEAVAREQALAVTEADRAAWIEQIASELGQSPGEVGAHLKARGSLSTIDAAILEDKALRAMLARAGAGGGGAAGGEAR